MLTVFDRRAAVCSLPTSNPCHDRIDQEQIAHPGGEALCGAANGESAAVADVETRKTT